MLLKYLKRLLRYNRENLELNKKTENPFFCTLLRKKDCDRGAIEKKLAINRSQEKIKYPQF